MQHLIVVTSTLITIEPLEHMSHLETVDMIEGDYIKIKHIHTLKFELSD